MQRSAFLKRCEIPIKGYNEGEKSLFVGILLVIEVAPLYILRWVLAHRQLSRSIRQTDGSEKGLPGTKGGGSIWMVCSCNLLEKVRVRTVYG